MKAFQEPPVTVGAVQFYFIYYFLNTGCPILPGQVIFATLQFQAPRKTPESYDD